MSTATLTSDASPAAAGGQEALLARHYEEFRRLARKVLNGDSALVRMQPTELAHEAAIRVMGLNRMQLRDRAHFLALSATVMRQTLVDEVRRARAGKRQAPGVLTMWPQSEEAPPVDVEALDEALKVLAAVSPERARVVELRFFAGLTVEEVAEQTGESESTVKRRWRAARAWLLERLQA